MTVLIGAVNGRELTRTSLCRPDRLCSSRCQIPCRHRSWNLPLRTYPLDGNGPGIGATEYPDHSDLVYNEDVDLPWRLRAPRPAEAWRRTRHRFGGSRVTVAAERADSAAVAGVRERRLPDLGFAGLLLALVALPLYPKIGLVSVGGTYIPVRIDDLVMAGVVLLWGVQLWRERRVPRTPPALTPAIAWLALGLVAVVIGAGLLHTVGWVTSLLYWAKPIEYLLLGWLAYDVVVEPRRLLIVLAVVFGTALVVGGYGVLQQLGWVTPPVSYVPHATQKVVTSTFGDRHELAMYLGMLLLLGVVLWHRAGRAVQVAAFVAIVVAVYLLARTSTRSEYLTTGALGLALLIPARTRIPAAVLVVTVIVVFFSAGGVAQRGLDVGGDVSLGIRFGQKWPQLIGAAMADPIFGIGPSAATEAADGHYVRSFVEVGIVGTAAFAWLILAVVQRLRRVYRSTSGVPRDLALAGLLMIAFIAVVGILIDAWVSSRPMQLLWPLLGIAAAGGSGAVAVSRAPAEARPPP
jgi:hypothetical protein